MKFMHVNDAIQVITEKKNGWNSHKLVLIVGLVI